MPMVAIRDIVQGQGLNKDRTPNALPPNAFSEVINGRFSRARIERYGGTQVYAENPTVPELNGARAVFNIILNGAEALLLMTATGVYTTVNGTTWNNRTPASGWADSSTWNFSQYGDWIIITSLDTVPFVLVPNAALFTPFTQWPADYKCQKIVPYKNFLVAVGVTITNNEQSGLVKWSGAVNPANLDQVGWDPADPTNLAGENVLPDRDGVIRDAGVLRDSLILYTDASVWRQDLSSTSVANVSAVFNFRKVFSDDGILQNRCFVEESGKHYVVGVFDIYVHNGTSKQSISDNRVTEFFYGRIGGSQVAFMDHYQRPQEIIISYAFGTNSEAGEALVYNYFYNTWTRWQFNPSGGLYTHFTQGPDFGLNIPTYNDWAASGIRFSDLNNVSFNDLFPQNRNKVPYILGPAGGGTLYRVDVGGATSSVTPAEAVLERRDLDLDEYFGGTNPIKYISMMLPQLVGEGTVRIQFGGRNVLNEPIIWQPERPYVIGQDYKFDLRLSARYPSFRIKQDASEGTFALDGFDLKVKAVSKR